MVLSHDMGVLAVVLVVLIPDLRSALTSAWDISEARHLLRTFPNNCRPSWRTKDEGNVVSHSVLCLKSNRLSELLSWSNLKE